MFGLSGWEIAIIALFGFMIFGPDKLPQIARTIGRVIRQFRSAQEQMNQVIKAEVYDPLKDLEPLANPFAGLSLEESKADAKKSGSAKAKTADKATDRAVDGKKTPTAAKDKAAADKTADKAADKTANGKTASDGKKLSGETLKTALSEEAAKAKKKALGDTAAPASAKAADADPASASDPAAAASSGAESFAQRRARLEREHARAKAAQAPTAPAATQPAPAPSGSAPSTAPTAAPDERREDEKDA